MLIALSQGLYAQSQTPEKLDSAVVVASRAGENTPVTYSMVGKEELRGNSPINSLPMSLNLQPSVIATNEGGTGLGYSKLTIRGSKGSQINVTLNGITLNDAESQEVFWVNIPALTNLLSSVQVQRGLGTNSVGSGAFGASINMSTASVSSTPSAFVDFGYGSYGTFTTTLSGSTGLTKSGMYLNFSYSKGITDGYIRNAKADVQSAFATLGWIKGNNSLKLTYLMGDQHSGITWNGIDLETYNTNRRYNSAGEWYEYGLDKNGKVTLLSTHYYDNDTDNYTQHHIQANYTHLFPINGASSKGSNLVWSTTINYTKGDGYYENYKAEKRFSKYDMGIYAPMGMKKSDFIIQKVMDNWYLVGKSDLKYSTRDLNIHGGVSYSRYSGEHFGNVLWVRALGDNWVGADGMTYEKFNAQHEWYLNSALKQEATLYARGEYSPTAHLTTYLDLQYRYVNHTMSGVADEDDLDYTTDLAWSFFNPRGGLTYSYGPHKGYFSAAVGHREPGRTDIKENLEAQSDTPLRPEGMVDIELGYTLNTSKVSAGVNLYLMEYWDMLLETGKLSDTGRPIRTNVGRSYRRGVELTAAYSPFRFMTIEGNTTLSLNKILNYVETYQLYDDDWNEMYESDGTPILKDISYGTTTMLMSPSVIAMAKASFKPFVGRNSHFEDLTISIDGKYVGKQFMDNTMTDSRSIPSYWVANLNISNSFPVGGGTIRVGGYINNLLNHLYYADGWCYKSMMYSDGAIYDGVGVFPQAPINFMLKVTYSF